MFTICINRIYRQTDVSELATCQHYIMLHRASAGLAYGYLLISGVTRLIVLNTFVVFCYSAVSGRCVHVVGILFASPSVALTETLRRHVSTGCA